MKSRFKFKLGKRRTRFNVVFVLSWKPPELWKKHGGRQSSCQLGSLNRPTLYNCTAMPGIVHIRESHKLWNRNRQFHNIRKMKQLTPSLRKLQTKKQLGRKKEKPFDVSYTFKLLAHLLSVRMCMASWCDFTARGHSICRLRRGSICTQYFHLQNKKSWWGRKKKKKKKKLTFPPPFSLCTALVILFAGWKTTFCSFNSSTPSPACVCLCVECTLSRQSRLFSTYTRATYCFLSIGREREREKKKYAIAYSR